MAEPRDIRNWAQAIDRLEAEGARTVDGRRLAGPLQGFGRMFQKTFSIRLGPDVDPETVIAEWKANFGSFWPSDQRFHAPLAGLELGQVGQIDGSHGPVRMETGVYVMYMDETSFGFINPEGHPWAGWITFSAHRAPEGTVARIQLLIRASDPLYDIGFTFLGGGRHEDRMWQHVLLSLAAHLGVEGEPAVEVRLVDRRRLWRNVGNVRYNAAIRSTLAAAVSPFRRTPPRPTGTA